MNDTTTKATEDTREVETMVWRNIPSNKQQWTASCGRLAHMIVEHGDGTASLHTVTMGTGGSVYLTARADKFTTAAAAAQARSTAAAPGKEAERSLAQWLRASSTGPEGEHWYLSTACWHDTPDSHRHCRSSVNAAGGGKVPGACKFGAERCVCPCHAEADPDGQ